MVLHIGLLLELTLLLALQRSDVTKMEVCMRSIDELERLQYDALKDKDLRDKLLAVRGTDEPYVNLCTLARSLGYEIYEMELIDAGESALAGMRRAINGGGENHSKLVGQDDYLDLFFSAIDK